MADHDLDPYLLSVVIPVSRMAGRLENLSQTLTNIGSEMNVETILIHDEQDSVTSPELKKIVQAHPNANVTLVERFIGSPGGARNLGLEYAKGSWINFVDSDDVFFPSILISKLREKDTFSHCAVISNYETLNSETKLVIQNQHRKSMTRVAINPGIWRWTLNRECIGNAKFSNLSMGEDQRFLYEFCKKEKDILFINDVTYRYTTNQKFQLTSQTKPKQDLTGALSDVIKIRQSTQDNYDEFTETLIVKLFISCLIHTSVSKKAKSLAIFVPLLSPFSRSKLRISRLRLRSCVER